MKLKSDGSIERYKTCLVAKGYTQQGVNYFKTFSLLALALTAAKNWHLQQLDAYNAFLHGELNEEIYIVIPQVFQLSKPNQVYKLLKSLYGLKQASRQWNSMLITTLIYLGYIQLKSNYSLFVKSTTFYIIILLIYGDDIVLTRDDIQEIQSVKAYLNQKFKIKDLGDLQFFLGLEIA
ncbi:hypothetical protein CR513_24599, partial [Mucuna pruriens]